MGERCDIVVVLPVGPHSNLGYVQDTLASIEYYRRSQVRYVVVDNSNGTLSGQLAQLPHRVIKTSNKDGKSFLYINSAEAYEVVLSDYIFDLVLRIDDDGLAIGYGFDEQALNFLSRHPDVGIFGSYRNDMHGVPRDFAWVRSALSRRISFLNRLLRPKAAKSYRALINAAVRHGYEPGESVLGGVCFLSASALRALHEQGLLRRPELSCPDLEDDHIFALLMRSAGFGLADFGTGIYPIGARHRGLPSSPGELEAIGKTLIHSVRSYGSMDEPAIRRYFAERRRLAALATN